MSLRSFSLLLVLGSLAFSLVCSFLIAFYGEAFVLNFLPGIASDTELVFKLLLLFQLLLLLLCALGTGLFAYYFLYGYVMRPLRMITASMNCFAEGTPAILPDFDRAPQELIELAAIYRKFSTSVTDAHAHDIDASRVKSDFISTAAHQLRTPLTAIRWSLEALGKESLTDDQKMLVTSASEKSRDLVAIVGTLLDISAIESGKYTYTFATTDITTLLGVVAADFAPLAQEMKVTLESRAPAEKVSNVRADADRIKWVLNNLIENAIRYTPAGGFVTCEVRQAPSRVEVLVRDTGIGIQSQDKNNIFERFYRASNAISKNNKGNGLGLYIARTIATDHGGDLTFTANPDGPGTLFILSLPIAL